VIAFNVVNKIEAALFIKMQDCFRISARSINMAALLKAFAQRRMVVNFAVENQPDAISTAMHWLMPGFREIDDGKPAKAQTAAAVAKETRACIVETRAPHHV